MLKTETMLNLQTAKLPLMVALQNMPVQTKPVTSAGAYTAATNLATTPQNAASKNRSLANASAAVMLTVTTKYNAAAMSLSTILKLAAEKNLNTMKWMNAEPSKDGFAINNANMYQNTTGNTSAAKKAALFLALNANFS
jgi:hypothetical protein